MEPQGRWRALRLLDAVEDQQFGSPGQLHDGVLALGGGAILDHDTRAQLREHVVVYLDVELSDATKRVGFNRDRPLLLANPRAQLHSLMEARRPLYEEVASVVVTTTGKTPAVVVAEIVETMAERS